METRNVIDYYHYWKTEAIKADLDSKRHNFGALVSNVLNDFNIGSVIRNANAFLAREVIIYGRGAWDRRGSVGTHLYSNLRHVKVTDDLAAAISGYRVVGFDNVPGSKPVEDFAWDGDKPYLMIFGQEQTGVPEELLSVCHDVLYIKQYGSVRSLNVGCASAIAMYDYCRKRA